MPQHNPKRQGRPPIYKTEFIEQARKLCALGATDVELGEFFGVRRETIWAWGQKHEQFSNALKLGKGAADERVVSSLYHKAIGYTHDAVKILQYEGSPVIVPYKEHVPPDTTAAIFWLKNRRSKDWRDVRQYEHGEPGEFDRLSDAELRDDLRTRAVLLGLPPPEDGETAH
jgi:hypothetical protein